MIQLLNQTDDLRREVSQRLPTKQKAALGQFMTPAAVARFMASLFPESDAQTCHLLDAGAGMGALTSAFLERWAVNDGFGFRGVSVTAYEIDPGLREYFAQNVNRYVASLPMRVSLETEDFIGAAVHQSLQGLRPFTHAILNPPYKKINTSSLHRLMLGRAGIETVNLYTAFLALTLNLMEPGGQVVAIVPRSFCNGPYYRPFRAHVLSCAAIRQIHLFNSRARAFKDDEVLQENVILHLERDGVQEAVTVSHSTDATFADLTSHSFPFSAIVNPADAEQFIHVPTSPQHNPLDHASRVSSSLSEIGLAVSTGPVVDFRLQEHIMQHPGKNTVPLLYPGHFNGGIHWPREGMKRGNAIQYNAETKKWLYPNGFYTVVRRFSAKEEKRRIVASVVDPSTFPSMEMLAFENHLNVFHEGKAGIPGDLAHGLAAFLNTTAVDEYFRRFNGHTQVNATDLRALKYPDRETLIALGAWARRQTELAQTILDNQLRELTICQRKTA